MKYAIISDIHGNMPALKLVLEDARKQGADAFLFAGDYCVSAPWFNDVISCLRTMPDARIIRGNEERYLHLPDGEDAQFAISRWVGRSMSAEDIAWVDALPERLDWECEGVELHMTHNSNAFIGGAEMQTFGTGKMGLERYPGKITTEKLSADMREVFDQSEDFHQHLSELPAGIYVFGHTHCQWHAQFGDCLFINPGSCGMALDCCEFGAPYTLLTVENGACTVEERRVSYDVEKLIKDVKKTEQYKVARVWSEVIFTEWRACRERMLFFLPHVEKYAQKIGDPRRPFMPDTWEAGFEDWKKYGEKP